MQLGPCSFRGIDLKDVSMVSDRHRILFICSPSRTRHALHEALAEKSLNAVVAMSLADAEPVVRQTRLAAIVCASQLIDGTYRDVFRMLARQEKTVPVIVVSLVFRNEECLEARRLGATDCLPLPLDAVQVGQIIEKAVLAAARHAH